MNASNPYAPPVSQSTTEHSATPIVRRRLALGFLCGSILFAIVWAIVNQNLLSSPIGPQPMIIITCALSIVCAYVTRDRIVAPLSCFCAILAATAYVASLRGMQPFQISPYIPLGAAGCSVPAACVAIARHWFLKRHVP